MAQTTQNHFSHFPFASGLNIPARPDALMNCLAFIPALIVPFSPFIAFFVGLLFLIVFSPSLQRWHRIFIAVVVIFAGAVLYGDTTPTLDRFSYHGNYDDFLAGQINAFFKYGNGIEIALPTFFWIYGKIFGPLNFSHFVALVIFTAGTLLYIWLEIYGLKSVGSRQKAICTALVLMCFDFWLAGQAMRQVFSSIIILYAITAQRHETRFVFILIAILFHTSALIFIAIIWLLVRYPKTGIGICAMICAGYVFFYEIADILYHQTFLPSASGIFRQKLHWYVYGYGRTDGPGIGFRDLAFSVFLLVCTWLYIDKSQAKWRHIIIGLGIIYLASAFVSSHLSLRVGILFFVAFGYFIFLALRKQPMLLYGFSFLYLVDLLVNIVKDGTIYKTFFYNYDIIGPFFYYLC